MKQSSNVKYGQLESWNVKFDKLGIQYFDVVYVQLDAKYLGGKYGHIGMESLDVQYHQLDIESWMAFSWYIQSHLNLMMLVHHVRSNLNFQHLNFRNPNSSKINHDIGMIIEYDQSDIGMMIDND